MADRLPSDDLLIRYIDGELPDAEAQALRRQLASDPALQASLTNLQLAVVALQQYGTVQQVAALHPEMMRELRSHKTPVVRMTRTLRQALTAAAAVLLLVVGTRVYQSIANSPDALYREAFVDFTASASRGGTGSGSSIETLYGEKRYADVTTVVRSPLLSAKDSLFIGLAYLQSDKAAQAVAIFERLQQTENDFRQDATFYLALAYLKQQRYAQALPLFRAIRTDSGHLYHAQVSEDFVRKVERLQKN